MIGSCWVHRGTGGSAHPKELREGWDVPFMQASALLLVSPTKHWSQYPPHSVSLPHGCCVPGMSCPPKSFKNADHCLKLAIPKKKKKKLKIFLQASEEHCGAGQRYSSSSYLPTPNPFRAVQPWFKPSISSSQAFSDSPA